MPRKSVKTLTRADLVAYLNESPVFSEFKAKRIVEAFIELIKQSLEQGEDVNISGFGKFMVKAKGPRRVRNPRTGAAVMLDARKAVIFKCSKLIHARINTEGQSMEPPWRIGWRAKPFSD